MLLWTMAIFWHCIWTKCVRFKTTCFRYVNLNLCCNNLFSELWCIQLSLWILCSMWLWLLNQYDLGCMLLGLKSLMISRNLGLYGLKLDKLSTSVEDFLTKSHIIRLICYKDRPCFLKVDPPSGAARRGTPCPRKNSYSFSKKRTVT
jgi:hypothetical protein